jgi:uncharacterized protein YxeA
MMKKIIPVLIVVLVIIAAVVFATKGSHETEIVTEEVMVEEVVTE